MADESYNIYHKESKIYSDLTREEYFDIMEDLSQEFYETGAPRPEDLTTEITKEN